MHFQKKETSGKDEEAKRTRDVRLPCHSCSYRRFSYSKRSDRVPVDLDRGFLHFLSCNNVSAMGPGTSADAALIWPRDVPTLTFVFDQQRIQLLGFRFKNRFRNSWFQVFSFPVL